jgi:hypothetical protein
MEFAYFSLAAILAALALGASFSLPASAGTDLNASAVHACTTANASQPGDFVAEVDDGRGGSLVWLTDADTNLWLCNADADGHIFAYSKMTGDLLQGAGANLVGIEPIVNETEVSVPDKNPLMIAEKACQAYLSDGPGKSWARAPMAWMGIGSPAISCSSTRAMDSCCATPRLTRRSGASPRLATRSASAIRTAEPA